MNEFNQECWADLLDAIATDDRALVLATIERWGDTGRAALAWSQPDDAAGKTALMLAYWRGNITAANALIEAGAEFSQRDASGRNAGWYARRAGSADRESMMRRRIRASLVRFSIGEVEHTQEPTRCGRKDGL